MCVRSAHAGAALQKFLNTVALAAALAINPCANIAWAAVPAAEKLLPDDALVVISAPDFPKLKEAYKNSPQGQLWNDPALKAFRESFAEKWTEEIVKPLQRDLDLDLDKFFDLLQGQLTLALLRDEGEDGSEDRLGFVFLADAGNKTGELKKQVADLVKNWKQWGKSLRVERIRGHELYVLPLSGNDAPSFLRRFIPRHLQIQEIGDQPSPSRAKAAPELVIGQAESLLLLGNSLKAAEKIVVRLAGGEMPNLADDSAYQAVKLRYFRGAPLCAWVNVKALTAGISKRKPGTAPPGPVDTIRPEVALSASGLGAIKNIAAAVQESNEGLLLQVHATIPESSRLGLMKMLTASGTDCSIPPFVPADAVKFRRWRIDGQKAWAAFEQMMADISPQWLSSIHFILQTANEAAHLDEPGFDVRKNLLGNLGDDLVTYEKKPSGGAPAQLDAAPTLYLLGSPNPAQFVAALKRVLIFVSRAAASPVEREFLGRKIYSVPLPPLQLPTGDIAGRGDRTLNYAASSSYVAISTDASLVEEFLRSAESQTKALRETPGLAEAAPKVTGPGTVLFGFENDAELKRLQFEAWRANPNAATNALSLGLTSWTTVAGLAAPEKGVREWMDFSLLPSFEEIAKYFHFTVHSVATTVDGITYKMFAPTPPGLNR